MYRAQYSTTGGKLSSVSCEKLWALITPFFTLGVGLGLTLALTRHKCFHPSIQPSIILDKNPEICICEEKLLVGLARKEQGKFFASGWICTLVHSFYISLLRLSILSGKAFLKAKGEEYCWAAQDWDFMQDKVTHIDIQLQVTKCNTQWHIMKTWKKIIMNLNIFPPEKLVCCSVMAVQLCYNRGCGKEYNIKHNFEDSCRWRQKSEYEYVSYNKSVNLL